MNNKITLFNEASLMDFRVDLSTIEKIVLDSLDKDLNVNLKNKIRLYSDEESYSVGLEFIEDKLSETDVESLHPYVIGEDFMNIDIAIHNYLIRHGANPLYIAITALDGDNEPHTPCEVVVKNMVLDNV